VRPTANSGRPFLSQFAGITGWRKGSADFPRSRTFRNPPPTAGDILFSVATPCGFQRPKPQLTFADFDISVGFRQVFARGRVFLGLPYAFLEAGRGIESFAPFHQVNGLPHRLRNVSPPDPPLLPADQTGVPGPATRTPSEDQCMQVFRS